MMMMSQNSMIFFILSYMSFTFFPVPLDFSDHHHSELTNVSDYLYFFFLECALPELSKLFFQSKLLYCYCPRTFLHRFSYKASPPHPNSISQVL